jgi:hypothetical protein
MVVASRAYSIGQFYAEVLVDLERASLDDQPLSQLEVDAPVTRLVSIGQRNRTVLLKFNN